MNNLIRALIFMLLPVECLADAVPTQSFSWLVEHSDEIFIGEVVSASMNMGGEYIYHLKIQDKFKGGDILCGVKGVDLKTSRFAMIPGGRYLLFTDKGIEVVRESLGFEEELGGTIFEDEMWLRQRSINRWFLDPKLVRQKEIYYFDPNKEEELFFSFLLINWSDLKSRVLLSGKATSAVCV